MLSQQLWGNELRRAGHLHCTVVAGSGNEYHSLLVRQFWVAYPAGLPLAVEYYLGFVLSSTSLSDQEFPYSKVAGRGPIDMRATHTQTDCNLPPKVSYPRHRQ